MKTSSVFSGATARLATTAVAAALVAGAGRAQVVKAPRYQGTVDAPVRQVNLPPLPPAVTPRGTVVEDVVARVNDQIISRSDVERAVQQGEAEAAQQNLSPTEAASRQRDMLRDMIDQQLLLSKAKELGLNADAELVRRLDEIRKQNKLETMEDLDKAARQQGVSFEDFKAQQRNQILTQQVVRDEVGRRLQMTQAEENKYYEEHKKEFVQPEQVRLSEILVPLTESATPAEISQAEAKANALKSRVMKGEDFADLAKKNSGGPTAAQGGELGLFKTGALAKVIEDQTFSLKPGESTQPIRTRQGYVILKVTEHPLGGPASLKEVEPQIQEALYMQAMQPALRTYLTKLRETAYVDIQPGFVDSGSSARETKPVFTSYAPPPTKKKAPAKNRTRFDTRSRAYASAPAPAVKTQVIASPDTTGGRTITGPEAKAAAALEVNPAIDKNTGLAVIQAPRSPKSSRREKIRFGQAPRNTLSAGADEAEVGTDNGASSGVAPAPGAVMASNGSDLASNSDDPLAPAGPERKKTRYSAKAAEHKEKKVELLSARKQEKVASRPAELTTDEKETRQTQAAPLGLGGDTTKKPAKPKKVKGAPKERLEEKKKEAPAAPVVPAPTANPNLAPTATTGTGLAPATPPVPQR